MSSMLSSQGVVIATAMVVSSAALFLAFSRHVSSNQTTQDHPHQQKFRSCLFSEEKKKQRRKKKRVQFAENVKDTSGNGKEYRREQIKKSELKRKFTEESKKMDRICRNEIPANRIALYYGILKDRVHRTECTY